MNTYTLVWSPEGKPIAVVQANTGWEARKQAPQPYRKYIGEIYAVRHDLMTPKERARFCQGHPAGEFDSMGQTVFCDGSCNK